MPLRLNRKTDYALVALAHLAELAEGDQPTASARQLAEQYHLPQAMLTNLLKELQQHGLVESTRGKAGGYRLALAADEVSVGAVVESLEGKFCFALCCEEEEEHACETCEAVRDTPAGQTVRELGHRLHALLHSVTLQDLAAGELSLSR